MTRATKALISKDSLRVKRSRTGLGLFAETRIPKGARIIEYTGRTVSAEEARTSPSRYLFEISKKKTIDGSARSNVARYINHSCKPNAEAIISSGRVFIKSLRSIKPGEEITYDYGKEYFDTFLKPAGCKCNKCSP